MLHFHILLVVLQQQEGGGNYFKWSESLCPKFSHLVTLAAPTRRAALPRQQKCRQATVRAALRRHSSVH